MVNGLIGNNGLAAAKAAIMVLALVLDAAPSHLVPCKAPTVMVLKKRLNHATLIYVQVGMFPVLNSSPKKTPITTKIIAFV